MAEVKSIAVSSGYNVLEMKTDLIREGARETGYAYNIARGDRSADVFLQGGRYLVIESSKEELDTLIQLEQAGLPMLTDTYEHLKGWILSYSIPMSTTPLDSRTYPEQKFTEGGHIGSFEIMREVGYILARIKETTGYLPENFSLSNLALTNGEEDFVKIIPSIKMSKTETLEQIAERIYSQLQTMDPHNNHLKQKKVMVSSFYNYRKD